MHRDPQIAEQEHSINFQYLLNSLRLDARIFPGTVLESTRAFSLGISLGMAIEHKSRGTIEPWQFQYLSNISRQLKVGVSA
jgi:hypothetical protein